MIHHLSSIHPSSIKQSIHPSIHPSNHHPSIHLLLLKMARLTRRGRRRKNKKKKMRMMKKKKTLFTHSSRSNNTHKLPFDLFSSCICAIFPDRHSLQTQRRRRRKTFDKCWKSQFPPKGSNCSQKKRLFYFMTLFQKMFCTHKSLTQPGL